MKNFFASAWLICDSMASCSSFRIPYQHIPHLVHHQLVAVVPTVPDAQRILGVVGIPCVILDGPKVLFRDKLPQRRHRRTAVIPISLMKCALEWR
jgi:hypothetical protein